MVVSCSVLTTKSGKYHTAAIQYYAGDRGELPGEWGGQFAKEMGLEDSISHNDRRIDRLLQGKIQ